MNPVKCVKCGKSGSLVRKTTYSKGKQYRYWYVEHSKKGKKSWCYIGKELPSEYKELRKEDTQNWDTQTQDTQKDTQIKNLGKGSNSENRGYPIHSLVGGGSPRLDTQFSAGPPTPLLTPAPP